MNEQSLPLVSVIITTYKGVDCIRRTVDSVINQSYKNVEIIVVDDNGVDTDAQIQTESILYDLIVDNELLYIAHHTNQNASVARNTGAKIAHGEYYCLLDDDDVFTKDKIKYQVEAIKNIDDTYGIVYCSFINKIYNSENIVHHATVFGNFTYKFLMTKVSACTSTLMIRKCIFNKLYGFDESFERHQDWEFLARASVLTKIYPVPYIGTIKYSKNIIRRFSAEKAETYRIYYINQCKSVIETLPLKQQQSVYAHTYYEIAKLYVREKNYAKVFHYLKKSKNPIRFLLICFCSPFKKVYFKLLYKNGKNRIVKG